MKHIIYTSINFWLLTSLFFLLPIPISAQGMGNCDPDALELVTKQGKAVVEVKGSIVKYFLDENEDGTADFILNFGPDWYNPENSEATRPGDGDFVKIYGGLNPSNPGVLPVLVVYEINDLYWRNPYEPYWNNFNDTYSGNHQYQDTGFICGILQGDFETETFTGVALVDTTFIFYHYFLDTDSDGLPDYKLNFGPPWYSPPTPIALPLGGETITVTGGVVELNNYPVIIVFELDGEIWRDTTGYGAGAFGGWMYQNQHQNRWMHDPFDTLTRMHFMQGWQHTELPDTFFGQMIQVFAQNRIQYREQGGFAGFEIGFFAQNGLNLMRQNAYRQSFNNQVQLQFHYNDWQLDRFQLMNEEHLRLKYWNHDGQNWEEDLNAVVDPINNLISTTSETLYAFYLLTADELLSTRNIALPSFEKLEVFPNPVDESLNIRFEVTEKSKISVTLFNTIGTALLDFSENTPADGWYNTKLDVNNLVPGIYYLRLRTERRLESVPVIILH